MGENMVDGIVIGVVAGIITSWVIYFGKYLWDTKFKPYWEELRYQGVIVSGVWTGKADWKEPAQGANIPQNAGVQTNSAAQPPAPVQPNPADKPDSHSEWRLYLEKSAHNLKGSFSIKFNSPHQKYSLDFKVTGYMWEGYLTLNCLPVDRRITSYATMLMKLHAGGGTLIGQICLRSVQDETVAAVPLGLDRTEVLA